MNPATEIIFVDDSRTVRKLARKLFKDKYVVHTCEDAVEAWSMIRVMPSIKIVFTDINMKGMDGIDLLKSIRESNNPRISTLPVIMITGASDSEESMRTVFELGATDFIAKPFKQMDLISRAYSYIKLSEQVNSLEQQSGIDKLSGLHDEVSMKQHAAKFHAFSRRYGTPFSIAHIDIRRIDTITERYGNDIASQIIAAIANKIKTTIRAGDLAARVDASRYVLLLPACSSTKARLSITRLMQQVEKMRFRINGSELVVQLLAGVSSTDVNPDNVDLDQIHSQARQSLVAAIQNNNDHIVLFDEPTDDQPAATNLVNPSLISAFNHILEGNYDKITIDQRLSIERKLNDFLDHYDHDRDTGTDHAKQSRANR